MSGLTANAKALSRSSLNGCSSGYEASHHARCVLRDGLGDHNPQRLDDKLLALPLACNGVITLLLITR